MSEPERVDFTAALERTRRAQARRPTPDDGEDDRYAEARARDLAELTLARWHAMIPQKFHRAQLVDVDLPARGDLEDWGRECPPRNLVLFGAVGVGKTHAAVAAVRPGWFDRRRDVLFAPSVEMLDQLRPGGPAGAFDALVDAGVLLLDDLGMERATDWTDERLYAVVNRRWLEDRPTVATTNLDPEPLRAKIGERLYSRLADGIAVRLAGTDRRRNR